MTKAQKIKDFYNDHNLNILVRDYIFGNKRFETAINFVNKSIPHDITRILDIGCGIGYSSWLLKRHFTKANVLGIDLSNKSIDVAKKLFVHPQIIFNAGDITRLSINDSFDLITMLDIYEHIPKNSREPLHERLRDLISDNGWLVVTTPTVEHQAYLRETRPEGLQIIDEDLSIEDLIKLAQNLNMGVTSLRKVAVWHYYDYQHLVARRNTNFNEASSSPSLGLLRRGINKLRRIIQMDPIQIRRRKVEKLLGFDPLNNKK